MKEQTYGQILAALLDKYGSQYGYTEGIHNRWTRVASGAKRNPAWLIGAKYI